jgi:hypothetical protein
VPLRESVGRTDAMRNSPIEISSGEEVPCFGMHSLLSRIVQRDQLAAIWQRESSSIRCSCN